jgi:hypothetical protein
VVLSLGCVRETTIRGRVLSKTVNTTRTPWNLRAAHFLPGYELPQPPQKICAVIDLDSSNTSECPKITIANPIKFLLYLLQYTTSNVETIVGAMESLGFETHGGIVAVLVYQM